jgi:polyhydroxybutyrate depolymerase
MPHTRLVARLLTVLLLLNLTAGCEARRTSTVDKMSVGTSRHTVEVGGRSRDFLVYRPAGLPAAAPLVLMLHGGFGTAAQAQSGYGWDAVADRERFLVGYPEGLNRAWSVGGGCCGSPGRDGVDEVAFIEAMIDTIAASVPLDNGRIYATGMSNGAMLSYRLACDSHRFAAVGPVAGTLLGDCPAPGPVSVIHIHGTADRNVPLDGSPGTGVAKVDGPPVATVTARWRTVDRCDPPTTAVAGPVTRSIADCPDGRAVELITVAGAGHQWPGAGRRPLRESALGADPPSDALDATATIWAFFAAHPGR